MANIKSKDHECRQVLIDVCDELAEAFPANARYFLAVQQKAKKYREFPVEHTLNTFLHYSSRLDGETVMRVIKSLFR